MRPRTLLAIVATLVLSAAAPSPAAAQVWTVANPAANGNYWYLSIPIDVTYDWGNGNKATSIDIVLKNPNTGNALPTITNNMQIADPPTNTSLRYTGSVSLGQVVANGTPINVEFTAKNVFGAVLNTKTVPITVRQTQNP